MTYPQPVFGTLKSTKVIRDPSQCSVWCIRNSRCCAADNFAALGDLIASYPLISRSTHFVLVPGPLDPTVSTVLPRRSIPSSFTGRLKSKVPRLHLASNPCRIKFFNQEVVIFRENVMARMLRNLVGVKPDVRNDDLKRYVSNRSFGMPGGQQWVGSLRG